MSPFSGLVDLFEAKNKLKKEGNSLVYVTKDGEIIKQFRKAWERNEKDGLTVMMSEWDDVEVKSSVTEESEEA
jgi:hypothetical protein